MKDESKRVYEIRGQKFVENSRGALVPEESVREIDLLRDQVVRGVVEKIEKMQAFMQETKAQCLSDIEAFVTIAAEEYGVKLGGTRGNTTLTSFDGNSRVSLGISDSLDLTEGIHAAKQLIDEYLTDLTRDSSADLRTLVTNAFRVKQGRMDVKRILELRSYNISDPRWKKAMDIISDSVRVASTRQHFRVHQRKNEVFEQMDLDFSTI